MEEIPEGQVYVARLEPVAPIRLAEKSRAPRRCTIIKKRWLNDGLPVHMIPSTRESTEDVIYTYS